MTSNKKQIARKSGRSFFDNMAIVIDNFSWRLQEKVAYGAANLGNIVLIAAPFITLFIGEYIYDFRGYWAIGTEVVVPIALVLLGFTLRSYARVSGNDGYDMPVPYRRFTDVDNENGQVDISYDRVQELILYMADLEDWFERNGYNDIR